jgi:cobyrinic acid a,c-diamide synthase
LPPLLGAIPRGAFPPLSSRNLGLVTADQGQLPTFLLDAFADALEQSMSLEILFPDIPIKTIKKTFRPYHGKQRNTPDSRQLTLFPGPNETERSDQLYASPVIGEAEFTPSQNRLRVGVAMDAAFHFYYPDLFDALAEAGCDIVFFSPLADRRLPEKLSGLYLGGGYPEVHAAELAANGEMLAALSVYAASGRPLYAECGGLMYLSRGIEADDHFYTLAGILPTRTRMLPARKALGYVEIVMMEDSLWGKGGDILRGHEFHYSEMIDDPLSDLAWRKVYSLRRCRSDAVETEGYQNGAILASYTHLHYASRPAAIARFFERCGGSR